MTTNTPWTFNGESVLDSNGNNACTKQNGPLIALAPEMAEALQECVKALEFGIMVMEGEGASTDQAQSALDEARDILARLPQGGGK